jgi:hypothetical protein
MSYFSSFIDGLIYNLVYICFSKKNSCFWFMSDELARSVIFFQKKVVHCIEKNGHGRTSNFFNVMSFFNKLGQMLGVGKKKTALPETEQHAFQIKLYGYNEYRTSLQTLHDHLRNFLTHMRTTIRGLRDVRFASFVSQFMVFVALL